VRVPHPRSGSLRPWHPAKRCIGLRCVRRGQIHPTEPGRLGSCAVRESGEGCGRFGVPTDAVSPCTVHPRRPRGSWGIPPDADFSASGHGSCHRPACPFCHGGQAQARQARVVDARLSAGAAVGSRPVESVLSTPPTGGTPNHLQCSALSYRRDAPGRHNRVVCGRSSRIHTRPERRDSLIGQVVPCDEVRALERNESIGALARDATAPARSVHTRNEAR
jgi:hypothetical protein